MEIDNIVKDLTSHKNRFISESRINKKYPDFHLFIFDMFDFDISWKEKFYLYLNKKDCLPVCECGNNLKFIKGKYLTYCSVKCGSNSPITKSKREKTSLKKYGFTNHMKNESYKTYGDNNISKKQKIKDKVKETNQKKFGVDYVSQLDSTKEKLRKSLKDKQKDILLKHKSNLEKYITEKVSDYDLEFLEFENMSIYNMKCNKDHLFTIHKNMLNDRIRNKNVICTECNIINSFSSSQLELTEFIKSLYNDEISTNIRTIINGELDIYLPELNLAFEFNGLYWHSEVYKDKNYHLNKTDKCLEKGIQLIHIWEDDWIYKKDIIKSRISNLLGKSKTIGARKCDIKVVSYKDSMNFLNTNHIQRSVISKIRLGLYYKDELVSLMTFGKLRKSLGQSEIDNHFELLRFCNKIDYSITGGASKLFKYFLSTFQVDNIISYADRSWSNGNLYENLGFKLEHITNPNYYYVVNNLRKNRYNFRKDRLIELGFDPNKSESKIMKERGYNKIYDSGSLKYSFKN